MTEIKSEKQITDNWKNLNPVVSVFCITYNHEKYIEEALLGFLKQKTNFAFEILIHDDASTDSSQIIIKKYEKLYPNVIKPIYQQENQYSLGKKINFEFNYPRAKGKYIALCEGDDYWTDPEKLQKQVDFMENNKDYVICYHLSKILKDNKLLTGTYPEIGRDYSSEELLTKTTIIPAASKLFRNIFNDNIKYDIYNFAEDTLLNVFLGFYGNCKYIGNIKPSVYRVHQEGIWSKLSKREKILSNLETFIKLCRLLEKKGCYRIVDIRLKDSFIFFKKNLYIFNIKMSKKNKLKKIIKKIIKKRPTNDRKRTLYY